MKDNIKQGGHHQQADDQGGKPEINAKNLEGHNQTWDNMRKTVEK